MTHTDVFSRLCGYNTPSFYKGGVMNNKEPIYFISALRWAFSITLMLTLLFLPFSFIYHSEISLDSKISSYFGLTSTFGIVVTIVVYLLGKHNSEKKQIEYDDIFFMEINNTLKSYIRSGDGIKENFDEILLKNNIFNISIHKGINDKFIKINLETESSKSSMLIFCPHDSNFNFRDTMISPDFLSKKAYRKLLTAIELTENFNIFIDLLLSDEEGYDLIEMMKFYTDEFYLDCIPQLKELLNNK